MRECEGAQPPQLECGRVKAGHEDKLRHLVYFGGAPKYRERLAEIVDNNYKGFEFG